MAEKSTTKIAFQDNHNDVLASDHDVTDNELQIIFDNNSPRTARAGYERASDNNVSDHDMSQIKYVLHQTKPQTKRGFAQIGNYWKNFTHR